MASRWYIVSQKMQVLRAGKDTYIMGHKYRIPLAQKYQLQHFWWAASAILILMLLLVEVVIRCSLVTRH